MDIVERLRETAHQIQSPPTMELRQAADEIERLREALKKIADGDVDRESVIKWRTDGEYSKNDRCKHLHYMYEECAECLQDFARIALTENK